MATLGIGVIVHQIASATDWLTAGESGIGGIPRLSIFGYTIESELAHYYLVWGTIAAAMLLSLHLIHSRVGRALRSVHGDELAARSLGVHASWYKVQVFMVSGAFASIAGSFHAYHETFVGPTTFGIHLSVILVVMVVVGGMSNVWGAFGGAVFLFILEEALRRYQEWMPVIYGMILLLIMMYVPQGLFVGIGQGIRKVVGLVRSTGKETAE
jgi:branched-chain amino acid transport system permease protein